MGTIIMKSLVKPSLNFEKTKASLKINLLFYQMLIEGYLAEVEEGKANPSIKFLHKIARALKVKISELLKEL